ncbi:hypothetical protein D9V84_06675 [Bacteroidetes/Chlorobi group bacterium Naka2016]|jgi:hypothetical protein|nr:MAG: hypothetical protein D9V84_06675 [Bacteroidetes/Chlorobi group bacterium Naka2016]
MRKEFIKKFFIFWFAFITITANLELLHFHSFKIIEENNPKIVNFQKNSSINYYNCLLEEFLATLNNSIFQKLPNLLFDSTSDICFFPVLGFKTINQIDDKSIRSPPFYS